MSKADIQRSYNEWPEEGYIPEDAYPLEVIHQDDTGYVLLQVGANDADNLIVAYSADFDYEEGAVPRQQVVDDAPYRKLNLAAFFEGPSNSAPDLLEALELYDEFSKANDDWRDDDDIPGFVIKAREAIAKAKGQVSV